MEDNVADPAWPLLVYLEDAGTYRSSIVSLDESPVLRIRMEQGRWVVEWDAWDGADYRIEHTLDLGEWFEDFRDVESACGVSRFFVDPDELSRIKGFRLKTRTQALSLGEPWSAEWIGLSPDEAPVNQWLCFRRDFDLAQVPDTLVARIAVDSKYWLWINGELVVAEGGLKRGPVAYGSYYDSVDLASHLVEGGNQISILVWHFGKDGFSHIDSGRAGLLFEADSENGLWVSDESWKVAVHPAFGDTLEPHPNARLPESNIRFDASLDIGDWHLGSFDDGQWENAVSYGRAPLMPWGVLVPRPVPQWRRGELASYSNGPELPFVSDGNPLVLNLPYNAQVHPYIVLETQEGRLIGIRTDNYMGGGEPNVRAEYVTKGGIQSFECYGWMNGHSVVLDIPAGVKVLELKYRESGYDTAIEGDFHCSDPDLNQLWKEAARTLYVNMRDTYMDCPDRERAQWWGDVSIQMGEAFYVLGRSADALARKGILELMNWQRSNGVLYSPVPSGNWNRELPTQMLASVGWYGVWTYYEYSGDRKIIEAVYPSIRRYMNLWSLDESGLVVIRKGDWFWGDWGVNKDMVLLVNAWYFLALKSQLEMARLLDCSVEIAELEREMSRLKSAFDHYFWKGDYYASHEHAGPPDERGNALAVVAGLASESYYPALKSVLLDGQEAGPYMEKYVLEALLRMGYVDDAFGRMKQRYGKMLTDDFTTLYEGWGIGEEGFGGGTYNHAWSGGPLTLLSQYVAGISPKSAGWGSINISPKIGSLERVASVVPLSQGLLAFRLNRKNGRSSYHLETPIDTVVYLHIGKVGELEVDGTIVERNAGPILGLPGELEVSDDGLIVLKLSHGVWNLATRGFEGDALAGD